MTASTEKAKFEFIIAPTLLEVESSHPNQIALWQLEDKLLTIDRDLSP